MSCNKVDFIVEDVTIGNLKELISSEEIKDIYVCIKKNQNSEYKKYFLEIMDVNHRNLILKTVIDLRDSMNIENLKNSIESYPDNSLIEIILNEPESGIYPTDVVKGAKIINNDLCLYCIFPP